MRGFLSGVFWGGLVSMLGVAGASQLVPIPPEESLFGAPAAKPAAPVPVATETTVSAAPAAAPAPVESEETATIAAEAAPDTEAPETIVSAAPEAASEAAPGAATAPVETATAAAEATPESDAPETTVSAAPEAAPAPVETATAAAEATPESDAPETTVSAAPEAAPAPVETATAAAEATPESDAPETTVSAAPEAAATPVDTAKAATAAAEATPESDAPETTVSVAPAQQVVIADPAAPPSEGAIVPAAAGGADQPAPAEIPATPPSLPMTDLPAALAAPEPPAPVMTGVGQDPIRLAQAETGPPPEPAADDSPAPVELPPPPPLTPAEEALVDPGIAPDGGTGLPGTAPAPMVPAAPGTDAAGSSSTLAPAPGLANEVEGVRTNRLPRIGDAPAAEPEAAPEAAAVPADAPPLVLNARAFENPGNKPLFAVVLFDTGAADLDRAALAALPFPVTFVVDPLAPGAAEAAAAYRAGGQEVVMLASGVPEGATAADLEQTFQSHAAALPEAVAVIDAEAGGLQGNRPLAAQIVPILMAQGRGLLTWDRGLNAADQVARRDGLPTASIFRRFDGEGEAAIRRNLDRAAFRAAQEGRVMVAGDTVPDTVAALVAWSLEGRAATVALAPVSAALSAP